MLHAASVPSNKSKRQLKNRIEISTVQGLALPGIERE